MACCKVEVVSDVVEPTPPACVAPDPPPVIITLPDPTPPDVAPLAPLAPEPEVAQPPSNAERTMQRIRHQSRRRRGT